MPVKCAVNGFGRIGRLTFKYIWDTDPTLEIVHVNDVCSCESAAYLLKYDSVHGTWDKEVETDGGDNSNIIVIGSGSHQKNVSFSSEKDFTNIDFQSMGIELVLECTGKFLTTESLQPYLDICHVKQIVVSAPVKEPNVLNVVLGCNHHKLHEQHYPIITNASCTTNCLAPVVKVIQENYGIVHGCITTIHVSSCMYNRMSEVVQIYMHIICFFTYSPE